jgi:hypothetical protein
MLRISFLMAALIGSFVATSAVNVPTTYCDSAKDLINIPGTLTSNVWPPALGDKVVLTLSSDVDDVILNTSFKINQEFLPISAGETKMAFDVPKGAHSGTYSLDVHGKKNGNEVFCVQAEWQLSSTPEDRGTSKLWADVAKRIAQLDIEREQMKKDAELNPPEDSEVPEFQLDFDPVEAHERMRATHDQVHAIYPHMMGRQQEVEVEDAPAAASA